MRQAVTAAPMTAAAFAGEAFSCARTNGASCAAHTAILLDAIILASIFVILGILSISLLGLIGLLLISLVVLLALPRRLRDRRSRIP